MLAFVIILGIAKCWLSNFVISSAFIIWNSSTKSSSSPPPPVPPPSFFLSLSLSPRSQNFFLNSIWYNPLLSILFLMLKLPQICPIGALSEGFCVLLTWSHQSLSTYLFSYTRYFTLNLYSPCCRPVNSDFFKGILLFLVGNDIKSWFNTFKVTI